MSHSITAPSTPSAYTASFGTQDYLTTSAGTGGSIAPASGWYNSGAVAAVSATANAGYQFSGFTGGLTGSTTPQNVTMSAPVTVSAGFLPTQTIVRSPAGLSLTVDGTACTAPCTFAWPPVRTTRLPLPPHSRAPQACSTLSQAGRTRGRHRIA